MYLSKQVKYVISSIYDYYDTYFCDYKYSCTGFAYSKSGWSRILSEFQWQIRPEPNFHCSYNSAWNVWVIPNYKSKKM